MCSQLIGLNSSEILDIDRLAHDMDIDDDDVPVRKDVSCFQLPPTEEEPRRRNPAPLPPMPDVTRPVDSYDNSTSRTRKKINAEPDTAHRG